MNQSFHTGRAASDFLNPRISPSPLQTRLTSILDSPEAEPVAFHAFSLPPYGLHLIPDSLHSTPGHTRILRGFRTRGTHGYLQEDRRGGPRISRPSRHAPAVLGLGGASQGSGRASRGDDPEPGKGVPRSEGEDPGVGKGSRRGRSRAQEGLRAGSRAWAGRTDPTGTGSTHTKQAKQYIQWEIQLIFHRLCSWVVTLKTLSPCLLRLASICT